MWGYRINLDDNLPNNKGFGNEQTANVEGTGAQTESDGSVRAQGNNQSDTPRDHQKSATKTQAQAQQEDLLGDNSPNKQFIAINQPSEKPVDVNSSENLNDKVRKEHQTSWMILTKHLVILVRSLVRSQLSLSLSQMLTIVG